MALSTSKKEEQLFPVDSENMSLFQCLMRSNTKIVNELKWSDL